MKVQNASIIYLDDQDDDDGNQSEFRVIVRPRFTQPLIAVETQNNCGRLGPVDDDDFWSFSCSPSEARELAQALIEAALVIERKEQCVTLLNSD